MHEAIAKQWIAALRSGKYPQAEQALRTLDGYCCLGVLCDLKGVEWTLNEGQYITSGAFDVLPLDVMDWAGMCSPSGVITSQPRECAHQLSALNDSGKTFGEIADIIETHWPEL